MKFRFSEVFYYVTYIHVTYTYEVCYAYAQRQILVVGALFRLDA